MAWKRRLLELPKLLRPKQVGDQKLLKRRPRGSEVPPILASYVLVGLTYAFSYFALQRQLGCRDIIKWVHDVCASAQFFTVRPG